MSLDPSVVRELWDAGEKADYIAALLNSKPSTVRSIISRKGFPSRRKPLDEAKFKQMWLEGVSGPEIAKEMGFKDERVVYRLRRKFNLPVREQLKPLPLDVELFTKLWNAGIPRKMIVKALNLSGVAAVYRIKERLGLPNRVNEKQPPVTGTKNARTIDREKFHILCRANVKPREIARQLECDVRVIYNLRANLGYTRDTDFRRTRISD